jgi:integrase
MATRPRGGSFLTEFMVEGERYRATFDTFAEGDGWEQDVRHAIKTGRPVPAPKTKGRVSGGTISTFGQVADYTIRNNWVDSPDYQMVVSRILKEAGAIIGENTPMADIKRPEIDRLVHAWRQGGNSPGTVNRKLAALSSTFKTAVELDVIQSRPPWPKRLKEAAHKLRFIYPQEEKLLLATASSFEDHDLADLIVFALDTGARFSEIVKARWDWFTPELTSWTIWSRKANNPFAMPLTQRVQKMLAARRDRQGGPFASEVYWSVRHRLERLLDKLGFDDVTFHTFRHTTASRLVQRGVDLRRVQVWMGHKAIATTIRYAKLAPNDLADVVHFLEPAAPAEREAA